MKKRYIVIAFVSFALLAGCLTTKPAIVTENMIKNPSMGFSGYEFTIPDGFSVVDYKSANRNDSLLTKHHKLGLKDFEKSFADDDETDFFETFLLVDGKNDISVSFIAITIILPPYARSLNQIPEKDQDFILKSFIGEMSLTLNKPEQKATKIQKKYAVYVHGTDDFKAKGGNMETANINMIFILGELDEMYIIIGISPLEKQEEINQLMEGITQDIKI